MARGTTSHGSVPLGDNPVDHLIRALNRIVACETPVRLTPAVDRFFKAQARDQTGPGNGPGSSEPAAALENEGGAGVAPERARAERAAAEHHHADGAVRDRRRPTSSRRRRRSSSTSGCCPTRTRSRSGGAGATHRRPEDPDRVHRRHGAALRARRWTRTCSTPSSGWRHGSCRECRWPRPASAGASDRPYWTAAGPIAYGIDPWLVELEESRYSVHGNNERLSLENIEFGLKYYVGVILEMEEGGGGRGSAGGRYGARANAGSGTAVRRSGGQAVRRSGGTGEQRQTENVTLNEVKGTVSRARSPSLRSG